MSNLIVNAPSASLSRRPSQLTRLMVINFLSDGDSKKNWKSRRKVFKSFSLFLQNINLLNFRLRVCKYVGTYVCRQQHQLKLYSYSVLKCFKRLIVESRYLNKCTTCAWRFCFCRPYEQGCQIFLRTTYQSGKKYSKLPHNIPIGLEIYDVNGRKIEQLS
jgi:hypothetical protein